MQIRKILESLETLGRTACMRAQRLGKWQCVLALCAALGWWGALYPELCLTPDTVCAVREESTDGAQETEAAGYGSAAGLYWELLDADCSRIRFKSRLAELWQGFFAGE